MKRAVKIGVFFILVLLVVNMSIAVVRHLDTERRIVEEESYIFAYRIEDIHMEAYERAYSAYASYTADAVMLPMFYNLTTIHPFLLEQMSYLREYMNILVDNITVENHNRAYEQFILCNAMDNDYSKNYTAYFARYDELYTDLNYIYDESIYFSKASRRTCYLVAFRIDSDNDYEGVWLKWYSGELYYFELQLEYISGILI